MIGGVEKSKWDLTKESILQRVTEKQIYEFYWRSFRIGHIYPSPLRKDSMPSFGIYATKNNTLRHHDFGKEEDSGNCFSFVSKIRGGLDLRSVLELINKDMCLGAPVRMASPVIYREKTKTDIQIIQKKFTQEDLKYWNQYAQDISDLKRNNVYSVDKLWVGSFRVDLGNDLCYAYLFLQDGIEYLKIYRPYAVNRADKWKYNGPNTLISGWDSIKDGGEKVIIVGSKKEEMCMQKLGLDVCSTQCESKSVLTESNIKFFQEKWKRRIIAWDPDPAGVEACTYYNQFGFDYANVSKYLYKSGVKDWADLTSSYGIGWLQQYLKNKNVL